MKNNSPDESPRRPGEDESEANRAPGAQEGGEAEDSKESGAREGEGAERRGSDAAGFEDGADASDASKGSGVSDADADADGSEDGGEKPERPARRRIAAQRRVSLVSAVWLVPLAALLAGLWLMYTTMSQTGPTITLHIDNADGMAANNTTIKILNVDVGRVVSIGLDESSKRVIMKAKLDASVKNLLKESTRFYVVKPRIDQTGVTGLGTLVSGSYIEMFPGETGRYETDFDVTDDPLMIKASNKGIFLKLKGVTNKLLPTGSPVLYKNITIGSVITSDFDPTDRMTHYRIFIDHPNDSMVGSNVKFSIANSINIENNANGISVNGLPVTALLTGAIAMSDEYGGKGEPVASYHEFPLYQKESDIPISVDDNAIRLVAFFDESVSSLYPRAAVYYQGIKVGLVLQAPYFLGSDKAKLFDQRFIPVLLSINPNFLGDGKNPVDSEKVTQSIMKALDNNLVASLGKESIVASNLIINLSNEDPERKTIKPFDKYGETRVIPTRTAGLTEVFKNINGILDQINRAPLTETVQNVNQLLGLIRSTVKSLNSILNDDSVKNMSKEVRESIVGIRETLRSFDSDSSAYKSVNKSVDEINRLLPRLRDLLNTLQAKPNSLLLGDSVDDPVPLGVAPSGGSSGGSGGASKAAPAAKAGGR